MNKFLNYFLVIAILSSVSGCNSSPEPEVKLSPEKSTVEMGNNKVSLEKHDVVMGNVSEEKIEEGLLIALDELQKACDAEKAKDPDLKIEGNLTFTFQVEPDGNVRMVFETGSELKNEPQKGLISKFASSLMKRQIKFPELMEMAMVEAEFKYE